MRINLKFVDIEHELRSVALASSSLVRQVDDGLQSCHQADPGRRPHRTARG